MILIEKLAEDDRHRGRTWSACVVDIFMKLAQPAGAQA